MRDMEVAAAVIGIRSVYAKLMAFAVSLFIVGGVGARCGGFIHLGSREPLAFDLNRSFQLLFMVIIGGLISIVGSFFGAAFIVMVPVALIVFFLIAAQHSLARLWSNAKEKLRIWPFPH